MHLQQFKQYSDGHRKILWRSPHFKDLHFISGSSDLKSDLSTES